MTSEVAGVAVGAGITSISSPLVVRVAMMPTAKGGEGAGANEREGEEAEEAEDEETPLRERVCRICSDDLTMAGAWGGAA